MLWVFIKCRLIWCSFEIREYCDRVKQNLDNCSFENKRFALDTLDIKVVATNERVEIKASVPFECIKLGIESSKTLVYKCLISKH